MPETAGSMGGKTCLVTGATAGIGAVTARELARLGATVILVGRDQGRGESTVEKIRRETDNPNVEFQRADLSSQREIRRLAREFLEKHDCLHVLVNNAGAFFAHRRESADGIEMTLALNHIAPFLLTSLVVDRLKASAPARVVNVSSDEHEAVSSFNFDDPQAATSRGTGAYGQSELKSLLFTLFLPMRHPGLVRYGETKLANLLFTFELARRLEGTAVTANALHPGLVASQFSEGNGVFGWFMRRWMPLLGKSPEVGADTSIFLACSPEVENVSGRYFVKRTPVPSSPASLDVESARRLWELSEELTRRSQVQ
jgi:retinol dehydrogenase 12